MELLWGYVCEKVIQKSEYQANEGPNPTQGFS